jgi:hypothetical protein
MEDFYKILLFVLVVIAAFFWLGDMFARSVERQACMVFSQESGRETKFVEYGFAAYDCLTPQKDGWISAHNLSGE